MADWHQSSPQRNVGNTSGLFLFLFITRFTYPVTVVPCLRWVTVDASGRIWVRGTGSLCPRAHFNAASSAREGFQLSSEESLQWSQGWVGPLLRSGLLLLHPCDFSHVGAESDILGTKRLVRPPSQTTSLFRLRQTALFYFRTQTLNKSLI